MERVGGFSAPLAGMKGKMEEWSGERMEERGRRKGDDPWEERIKVWKIRFRRRRCGRTLKGFSSIIIVIVDWPCWVFVWIATHHFIIEDTHTHTAMITILHITGVQITAWLPMGLPIHCNPSNTLNFHFKQKLNRQKTQGSILLSPLSFFLFTRPHF